MAKECGHLIDYLAGELASKENEQYQRHIAECEQCSLEFKIIQEAWVSLAYEAEEVDVPIELKAEIMDFVFHNNTADNPARKQNISQEKINWFDFISRNYTRVATALIAVLFISIIGLLYENIQLRNTVLYSQKEVMQSLEINEVFALQSVVQSSDAAGYAAVIKTGNGGLALSLDLKDLPQVEGEEVYQVWLLEGEERHNAGTFRPDQNGKGVMTYQFPEIAFSYDDIGITLEPDAHGTKPRGKKVVGIQGS